MKVAYILLVLAALAVSSQIVFDLVREEGHAAAASREPIDVTPKSVAEESPGRGSYELDPTVAKQVEEILKGEDSTVSIDGILPTEAETESATENSDIPSPGESTTELVPIGESPLVSDAPELETVVTTQLETTATSSESRPVRQEAPLHPQMVTPGNFEYLGAIRPPHMQDQISRFSYGGWAIAYREDGDPNGPDDGFPGSLYIGGHRHQEMVAEVTIPKPVVSESKNLDELPIFKMLQGFGDPSDGIREHMTNGSSEPFQFGGLHVVKDKLHWTLYKYYNVEGHDYLSHGLSSVNLANPQTKGLWHLGPFQTSDPRWHSYKNAGYICEVPDGIAKKYLGGRNMISGLQISTGLQKSSQGPALFAYRIPDPPPPPGASIDAVPLLWYPMASPVDRHHYADRWTGAAWLTLGDKHTVVVVGRKAHGEVYYGMPRPGDCYEDKGYHGSSYEVQMLFYAPGDLLAAGRRPVANVKPWYRWDTTTPGGSLNRFMYQDCGKEIGGMTYDRKRNLLYMMEMSAGLTSDNEYEPLPIVHVLRVVQ